VRLTERDLSIGGEESVQTRAESRLRRAQYQRASAAKKRTVRFTSRPAPLVRASRNA
jgi:hypothetical protein